MVQKSKDSRLFKPRNPIKVSLERYHRHKVYKSKRNKLLTKEADRQITDFYKGEN